MDDGVHFFHLSEIIIPLAIAFVNICLQNQGTGMRMLELVIRVCYSSYMKFLDQNHVKFALLMTGVLVLCLLFMELTGDNQSFEKSPLFMIAQLVAPLVIWFFGIKARKDMNKGKLRFKDGVMEGFKISLVFAIVSPFVFLGYYTLVNPGIVRYVREAYRMDGAQDNLVILADMCVQFVAALLFGTIYGAIVSFFLKTKPEKRHK